LFEEYAGLDCCAREEPFSKRSHQGYNRSYLDEELYHEIATHEGVAVLDPFNCGVVLLSGRVAAAFVELHPIFVDYAWRFTVWMALNPVAPTVAGNFPEGRGIDHLRRRFRSLTRAVDIQRLLPFPSSNRWILEEVAFWFTLGHIHGVRYADFSMRHALQGGEVGVDVHERSGVGQIPLQGSFTSLDDCSLKPPPFAVEGIFHRPVQQHRRPCAAVVAVTGGVL
jgi:hypothetical protein